MMSNLWYRHLTVVAVLLLCTVLSSRTFGQMPGNRTRDTAVDLEPESYAVDGSDHKTTSAIPLDADARHSKFWIVSSRVCCRCSRGRCVGCNFKYWRYTESNCLHSSNQKSLVNSLQPGTPVCLVVHGSYVLSKDVLQDSLNTYQWLRAAAPELPLHVVFFTWPSEGVMTLLPHNGAPSLLPQVDVAVLGRRSSFHGVYLAQLMSSIPADHPISLIGHSHGARTVSAAVHLFGEGSVQGYVLPYAKRFQNRIRVVLAAAAIDHHWLNPGERYGQTLIRAEWLLNFKNRRDWALSMYPFRRPFSHQALACRGFTRKDRNRQGWLNAKTSELDVTELLGKAHLWPHYYRHVCLARTLIPYVYFADSASSSNSVDELAADTLLGDSRSRKLWQATHEARQNDVTPVEDAHSIGYPVPPRGFEPLSQD